MQPNRPPGGQPKVNWQSQGGKDSNANNSFSRKEIQGRLLQGAGDLLERTGRRSLRRDEKEVGSDSAIGRFGIAGGRNPSVLGWAGTRLRECF